MPDDSTPHEQVLAVNDSRGNSTAVIAVCLFAADLVLVAFHLLRTALPV
jgi:hypothetical protein